MVSRSGSASSRCGGKCHSKREAASADFPSGRQALASLCELSAVDMLIVDRDVTPEQAAIIDHAEVRVLLAGLTGDGQAEEGFHA